MTDTQEKFRELIARLRDRYLWGQGRQFDISCEAADALEKQQKVIDRLRDGLQKCAMSPWKETARIAEQALSPENEHE